MQGDGHIVQTQNLDGHVEHNLTLLKRKAALGDGGGNVAGGNGAVELTRITGLADCDECRAAQFFC